MDRSKDEQGVLIRMRNKRAGIIRKIIRVRTEKLISRKCIFVIVAHVNVN